MSSPSISFGEKVAYGLGNFLPTTVTAVGGFAMFFYTDVAGLSAAFIGMLLLAVRIIDAVWDISVGRFVDRTRTRFGRCRPYLLGAAPVLALMLVASFSLPPFEGIARTAYFVAAYVAVWLAYSLVQIPFQSMLPLVAPDPDERLRLAGVNSFVQFLFVVACGAGFPMLKDALGQGDVAQGFQRAALVFGLVGWAFTWICFTFVRERVTPPVLARQPDLRGDLAALWHSRAWRAAIAMGVLLAVLIGVPLSAGIYYFNVIVQQPQLIGPFMGLGGLGLVTGVVLSDRLTRHFCKKRVFVTVTVLAGVLFLGYAVINVQVAPQIFVLAFLTNLMLGAGAPISYSIFADTADAVEQQSGRQVVGTLFATVNFSQKVGSGLSSAIVGGLLAVSHYAAGQAVQPPEAATGVIALMSVVPAAFAFGMAAILAWGYPLDRAALARLREQLTAARAQPAA